MLEPNSRRLLMESLQPPVGYRLDWAVGTTYSLDLMALLTAPVAFAFSDWQDRDGKPVCDPLALLKAVRQYAKQICLFCQAGKIHVPKTYQPLLASLEDSIVEANAPLGGSFHPKMWFLRFVDAEDETVLYRVLCASRNMTFDRSWDTLLCLEGEYRDRTNAYSKNHPLGQFVEALPRMSVRPMSAHWMKRINQLAYEIRRVDFEIPEPFEDLDFYPFGIGTTAPMPFPDRMERLFVISPFVSDSLINELKHWKSPTQLLSRGESLGRLAPSSLASLEKVWVLDDTATPEPGETEEAELDLPQVDESSGARDIPLIGLHAKVYVAEQGWKSHVFTGSANATHSAFNKNVEFLVELKGKKSCCGIDAMLGQGSEGDRKRTSSLAGLIQPYVPAEGVDQTDSDAEAFERQVEELAKRLAEAVPTAECEPGVKDGTYRVRLTGAKPLIKILSPGLEVRVRPASQPSSQFYPVGLSDLTWVEFTPVSLLGLTSFFVFEVESVALNLQLHFVLNIPLKNAPLNRDESILRHLLSDRDRVLQFLLLLLLDAGARDLSNLGNSSNGVDHHVGLAGSMLSATLFESLIRALDRDPGRIDQMAEVIRDLQTTDEGRSLLPDDLAAIWDPIWEVRSRQIERKKRLENRS